MESIKNSNILFRSKINNVNRNYIYRYSIEDKEENFNKLAEVINKKEYYILKAIFYIIENCRIIEEDSGSITVKIDLLEHDHLLQNTANKLVSKKIKTRKFEKKIEHEYKVGNLFSTIKIYNGF